MRRELGDNISKSATTIDRKAELPLWGYQVCRRHAPHAYAANEKPE
jgi:hypothetical protein